MNVLGEGWDARIASALEECAMCVERIALGRWSFVIRNGSSLRAGAARHQDWLLLDAPLGQARTNGSDPQSPSLELLERTRHLPGMVKYAATEGLSLRVRAELPLIDDLDLPSRLGRCLAGFAVAHGAEGESDELAEGAAIPPDLERLCVEAGWTFTPREPGRLMVPLETGQAFVQAMLELEPRCGVVASVPLVGAGTRLPAPCEHAVAVLALRVAGAVRMVRAAATPDDRARLEVRLGSDPMSAELGWALASLSVAWQLAGREAEVLARDATVAAQYVESVERLTRRETESTE